MRPVKYTRPLTNNREPISIRDHVTYHPAAAAAHRITARCELLGQRGLGLGGKSQFREIPWAFVARMRRGIKTATGR